jgi:polar amino acid transport system substrate-binding protein
MKLSRRPFAVCLGSAAVLLVTGRALAQTALEDIVRNRKIKIGVPIDLPPYGTIGTDAILKGLDIDMAELIAAKLGVRAELVWVTSAQRIPYLQSKKVDLVISTLGKTPEREQVIDFSSAYSPFFQAVFGARTLAVKEFADLRGKTIAVTGGAIEDTELTRLAPPASQILRLHDNTETVASFVAGNAQLIAISASVAGNLMARFPHLGIEYKLLIKDSPNYIGLPKGEPRLRQRVNEIIAEARGSGDIDRICLRWLGRAAGNLPV